MTVLLLLAFSFICFCTGFALSFTLRLRWILKRSPAQKINIQIECDASNALKEIEALQAKLEKFSADLINAKKQL